MKSSLGLAFEWIEKRLSYPVIMGAAVQYYNTKQIRNDKNILI